MSGQALRRELAYPDEHGNGEELGESLKKGRLLWSEEIRYPEGGSLGVVPYSDPDAVDVGIALEAMLRVVWVSGAHSEYLET